MIHYFFTINPLFINPIYPHCRINPHPGVVPCQFHYGILVTWPWKITIFNGQIHYTWSIFIHFP